jgi:hypothetical protein
MSSQPLPIDQSYSPYINLTMNLNLQIAGKNKSKMFNNKKGQISNEVDTVQLSYNKQNELNYNELPVIMNRNFFFLGLILLIICY